MKRKRRHFIVSPGFQWRFVLTFAAAALAGSAAATTAFHYFAVKRLEAIQYSVFARALSTGEVLGPVLVYVTLFSLVFVIIMFALSAIWMMRRITGPVTRLSNDLNRIAEGDFTTAILLRRNDEFRDVATACEAMREKLRERFLGARSEYSDISQALEDLLKAHAHGRPIDEEKKRIIGKVQQLRDLITTQSE